MQREPGEPDPVDEFERIVAGWRREKSVPAWPDDPEPPAGTPAPAPDAVPDAAPDAAAVAEPAPGTGADTGVDEDHYVPPEPPPLPPVGPPALVGLALLVLGLILVAVPWWIGVPDAYGLPLGLVTIAGGLGWLVLRMWPDEPLRGDGDGPDDGAIL